MAIFMHKHLINNCGIMCSEFYVNAGKERFCALLNQNGKYALLTNASFYNVGSNTKSTMRIVNELASDRPRYYLAQHTITNAIRGFFAQQQHTGYNLIIDTVSRDHQTCLVIENHKPGSKYRFFALDPNHQGKPSGYSKLAIKIAKAKHFVHQWTSISDNEHGLSYPLTWRFIYLIMAEGYDPINQEHDHAVYNLIRDKQELRPTVSGKSSALDYRVRNRTAEEEVALFVHNQTSNLIWTQL